MSTKNIISFEDVTSGFVEYRFEPIGTVSRTCLRFHQKQRVPQRTQESHQHADEKNLKISFPSNFISLKKKNKNFLFLNFKHLYLLHDSTNRTTVVRPRCCAVFPDISFLKRSLLFSLFTFMPLWGRRRRRRVFLLLHSHLL